MPYMRQRTLRKNSEGKADTRRNCSRDGVVDQKSVGAKAVSADGIFVNQDMNGARGIMLRALYGNLGRFQAAGAEVALVADLAKKRLSIFYLFGIVSINLGPRSVHAACQHYCNTAPRRQRQAFRRAVRQRPQGHCRNIQKPILSTTSVAAVADALPRLDGTPADNKPPDSSTEFPSESMEALIPHDRAERLRKRSSPRRDRRSRVRARQGWWHPTLPGYSPGFNS